MYNGKFFMYTLLHIHRFLRQFQSDFEYYFYSKGYTNIVVVPLLPNQDIKKVFGYI